MKNISGLNRALRLTLGLGIVIAVLGMSGPVGGMVYALFISIYTGITAFIGWDPVIALMDKGQSKGISRLGSVHRKLVLTH